MQPLTYNTNIKIILGHVRVKVKVILYSILKVIIKADCVFLFHMFFDSTISFLLNKMSQYTGKFDWAARFTSGMSVQFGFLLS